MIPEKRMPPAESHKTLSTAQIDVLRFAGLPRGRNTKEHWAFTVANGQIDAARDKGCRLGAGRSISSSPPGWMRKI